MKGRKREKQIISILMSGLMIFTTPLSVLATDAETNGYDTQVLLEENDAEYSEVNGVEVSETNEPDKVEDASQDLELGTEEFTDGGTSEDIIVQEENDETEEEVTEEQLIGEPESDEAEMPLAAEQSAEKQIAVQDEDTADMQACVNAVFDAVLKGHTGQPQAIEFPYGTGKDQYTNARTYFDAKMAEVVADKYQGKYTVKWGYSSIVASPTEAGESCINKETLDLQQVHLGKNSYVAFYGSHVYIEKEDGTVVKSKAASVNIGIAPITVTPQQAADYEAEHMTFDVFKADNRSEDRIYSPLGVYTKTVNPKNQGLPLKGQAYKTDFGYNSELGVQISWEIKSLDATDEKNLVLRTADSAGQKTTITRPDIGKSDARYELTALFTNPENEDVFASKTFTLTVPAYQASVLPVRVSPADATLTIKDGNTEIKATSTDGALRTYTLHGSATDGLKAYSWTASRNGYVTESGTFQVGPGSQEEQQITLQATSEEDTKLKSLVIESPNLDSTNLIVPINTFNKDITAYEMTVADSGVYPVTIRALAKFSGAIVKVKRFTNVTNANNNSYMEQTLTATSNIACYLKKTGDTVITITVTPPAGSSQKSREYTITVHKAAKTENVRLKKVSVLPGGTEAVATEDGYMIELPDTCQKVSIAAEPWNTSAIVTVNGREVTSANGYLGDYVVLNDTETKIPVVVKASGESTTSKTYTVTVKKVPAGEQAVNIGFAVVGDDVHESAEHEWNTLWMKEDNVTVPAGSTVRFVTEMMLQNKDIPYTEASNNSTISKIKDLAEKANGTKSKWVYAINGKVVTKSMKDQTLTENSQITWFYVDDSSNVEVPDLNNLNPSHVCVWDDGVIKKEATCTEDGEKIYTCQNKHCGKTKTETIKATGHNYDEGKITKEATCTEDGEKTYTCTKCGAAKTEVIKATGHKYGDWVTASDATVFAPAVQKRTCTACGNTETRNSGTTLQPTIKVNATTVPLKVKQKTSAFKVTGLAAGDSVQSYRSSNTKIFTVSKSGVLKAGKKTGKATLTITLASGLQKKVTVKVQKKTVTTSKITGLQKKVMLKKGAKLSLKPSMTPITSTQKFTYKSSNKKIATVSSKGVITAKKAGKAKITVKSGKKKFTVTVTVTK